MSSCVFVLFYTSMGPIIIANLTSLKSFVMHLSLEGLENIAYYIPLTDDLEQIIILPNNSILMPNGTIHNGKLVL